MVPKLLTTLIVWHRPGAIGQDDLRDEGLNLKQQERAEKNRKCVEGHDAYSRNKAADPVGQADADADDVGVIVGPRAETWARLHRLHRLIPECRVQEELALRG